MLLQTCMRGEGGCAVHTHTHTLPRKPSSELNNAQHSQGTLLRCLYIPAYCCFRYAHHVWMTCLHTLPALQGIYVHTAKNVLIQVCAHIYGCMRVCVCVCS